MTLQTNTKRVTQRGEMRLRGVTGLNLRDAPAGDVIDSLSADGWITVSINPNFVIARLNGIDYRWIYIETDTSSGWLARAYVQFRNLKPIESEGEVFIDLPHYTAHVSADTARHLSAMLKAIAHAIDEGINNSTR